MKLNYLIALCLFSLIGLLSVPIQGEKTEKSPKPFNVDKNLQNEKTVFQSTTQCSNVILASDIGETGFFLPSGGNWCLGEDVIYFPNEERNPAIFIPASAENVILDLNGHTLKQGESINLGVIGIVVERGAKNITIKNGTIRDFTFVAINAGAQDSDFITGLTISGINILNNGSGVDAAQVGGINLFNVRDVVIENSNIRENRLAGLRTVNTIKLYIDNSHFDDNVPGTQSAEFTQSIHGANLSAATDTVIRNSTFNNNLGNGQSIGLLMDKLNTVLIDRCQCNSNKLDARAIIFSANNGGSLHGAKLTGTGITIHNSQFNDNTAEFNEGEFDGNFFQIDIEGANINAQNLTIDNSEFCNTRVTARTPVRGILGVAKLHVAGLDHVSSTNVKVSHSTFSGQRNSNENVDFALHQVAYGAVSFQSNSIDYFHCMSDDNRSSRPSIADTQIFSIGQCHQLLTNGTFRDCSSSNNQHAGGTRAIAAGYLVTNANIEGGNVVFKDCVGQDNSDSADNADGAAAGFITSNLGRDNVPATLAQNYFFDGCIAQRNTSIGNAAGIYFADIINSQVSNTTASRNTIGILVENFLFNSRGNIINNNTVSHNNRFGIADVSNTEDNAYYSNHAFNNSTDPLNNNYFSVPRSFFPVGPCGEVNLVGTPIRLWTLSLSPCNVNNNLAPFEILDNISMRSRPVAQQ